MNKIHIITPVKDSIELTRKTAEAVMASRLPVPFTYTIYNDFSTPENTAELERMSRELGFRLVNLSELTDHPSPNYRLTLITARREALAEGAGLLIVESDVVVPEHALGALVAGAAGRGDCALAAAVTVDEQGRINYPYEFAEGKRGVVREKKHLSFCCTLMTPSLLEAFDFELLDPEKQWHDVTISHMALRKGFANYLFTDVRVLHRPHGSRPWKLLKYQNKLKYYWLKITKGRDKI